MGVRAGGGGGSGTVTASGCKVTPTGVITLAGPSTLAIPWGVEEFDDDGWHDNAVSNSRLTVPSGKAGLLVIVAVAWTSSTWNTGARATMDITKNGASIVGGGTKNVAGNLLSNGAEATIITRGAVGDFFEAAFSNLDGGPRTLDNNACMFSVARIGA